MLGRTTSAVLGLACIGTLIAACSASDDTDGIQGSGAGGNGAGASGGIVNIGGSGAANGLGGFGTGGNAGSPSVPMVPCDESMPCADGSVCAAGFCAPNMGPCTTDADCDGDSYCCGEGCRDDGVEPVCIPYGYGPRGNVNSDCKGEGEPVGVFAPSVQCEWLGPSASDLHPDSNSVLTTPLVADLPNDSGASAEIVVLTYGEDGDGSREAPGVLRILNGQTCELLESVYDATDVIRANATPALADLNNDGTMEIVTRREGGGAVAFEWDGAKYVRMWAATTPALGNTDQNWDGPSIHDLDNDGNPEVLIETSVLNGQTGAVIFDGTSLLGNSPFNGFIPVAADLDGDGVVELVGNYAQEITYFSWEGSKWVEKGADMGARFGVAGTHFAVADFGTPGASPAAFDPTALDGVAEIVAVDDFSGLVTVHTLDRQRILQVATADRGGPPTIADFDNDGFPEVAVAGKTRFRIFDFDCIGGGAACEDDGVLWSQPSQDASSAQTGVAVFDFDGDGQAEAVYADECFLRVYNGSDGEVLYSAYRSSGTWYESPVVADVDKDDNTEIIVNNNYGVACPEGGTLGTPYVDPLHKGVRCDDDGGCVPGGSCIDGYCRCAGDEECDTGMTCAPPLAGTPGTGDVCRATHPNSALVQGGVRVLRDRLDRWASSRSMWNQHAYSITNVNDDGSIPKTSEWLRNWTQDGLNNFRQNVQGAAGFADYPDITGALEESDACVVSGGTVTLTATVCNRGAKAVGAAMPATFYKGEVSAGEILCVSYTAGPVPVEGCLEVSCTVESAVKGLITMVVNDDGAGGQTTVECNSDNNEDTIVIDECIVK